MRAGRARLLDAAHFAWGVLAALSPGCLPVAMVLLYALYQLADALRGYLRCAVEARAGRARCALAEAEELAGDMLELGAGILLGLLVRLLLGAHIY